MRRLLPAMTILGCLAVLAACGTAPAGSPEEAARRVESKVFSPYCPGRLLSDCTTQQANELRAQVTERIQAGQDEAEVMAWLRSNYGDEVLATPRPGLAGALIWLVPIAALLAGLVVVAGLVRRWTAEPPPHVTADTPQGPDGDEVWIQRVRDEVRKGL